MARGSAGAHTFSKRFCRSRTSSFLKSENWLPQGYLTTFNLQVSLVGSSLLCVLQFHGFAKSASALARWYKLKHCFAPCVRKPLISSPPTSIFTQRRPTNSSLEHEPSNLCTFFISLLLEKAGSFVENREKKRGGSDLSASGQPLARKVASFVPLDISASVCLFR